VSKGEDQLLEQASGIMNLIRAVNVAVEERTSHALRQDALTLPQYQLLCTAADAGDDNIGDLAERLHCSRGNLTGVLDRLERDGWLVRDRLKEDRRVIRPRFTEKGARVRNIRERIKREMATWTAGLTAAELEQLGGLLKKAYRILSRAETA